MLRLCAAVLVLAASCKRAPSVPPPPEVVEVRVIDRTPPGAGPAPLDTKALTRRAAEVLSKGSGLRITDGGTTGRRYRLKVELRMEGAEAPSSGKGVLRAFVSARLVPVSAEELLPVEQVAVAERVYDLKPAQDKGAMWRDHAGRAVEDVVRTVATRVRLASGDSAALLAAVTGSDSDLREEAIRLAGERRDEKVVPALLPLLKSEDSDLRDRVIGALGSIGDRRAVRPLTEVARFRDVGDLPKVLDALAAIGGEDARSYLEFVASGHESEEIRELAKQALTHLERHSPDATP